MSLNLRDARKVLRVAADAVTASLATIETFKESISRERVSIGIQYVLVDRAIQAQPSIFEGNWKAWAEKSYPGGPDAYKLFHAGTVALVIGDVGDASERHLVHFYRILKSASVVADKLRAEKKPEEADAAMQAAEELVRKVWAQVTKNRKPGDPMPSEEKFQQAIDKATGTSGGTRGKKAGTSGTSGGTKRSTRKSRGKKAEEKAEPIVEVAPAVSEKELRSLASKVRTAVSRVETEDLQNYLHSGLAVSTWCAMYGTEAVKAALRTEVRDAVKTRKAAA